MPPPCDGFQPALYLYPLSSSSALKRIPLPTLGTPLRIGRLTQTEQRQRLLVDGKKIKPEEGNGYFEEETIEENHANVWQDPKDKKIYIQSTRSGFMTYLNENRLYSEKSYELKTSDLLELGYSRSYLNRFGATEPVTLRVVCILNQIDLMIATRAEALNPKMLVVPEPAAFRSAVDSFEYFDQLVEICQVAYSDCRVVADKGFLSAELKAAQATFQLFMNLLREHYRKHYRYSTTLDSQRRMKINRLDRQERKLRWKLISNMSSNSVLRKWTSYDGKDAPEISWLLHHVEELYKQMSVADKTRRKVGGRSIEGFVNHARRKWHIGRLGLVMGLLIGGVLTPDKVKPLREAVTDFVENNMEQGYKEKRGIYDRVLMLENDDLDEGSNGSSSLLCYIDVG
ncbi:general negative regulator of transcription subunit 5 [Marasmius crinis-equi]|uniref:General negative regulator of transcription subunit 5 n=1 Tax=Marasmius crinis-equi TaxID=585013 RepID=A0ABR3EXM3_9AGAR